MTTGVRSRVFFDHGGIRGAVVGPVMVAYYHGPLHAGAIAGLADARRKYAPDARADLAVIAPTTPIPSADVVSEALSLAGEAPAENVCEAAVLLGGGVWAVAGRKMINSILARTRPYPTRLFLQVPPASVWIADHLPDEHGLSETLELAVEALRQGVHAPVRVRATEL